MTADPSMLQTLEFQQAEEVTVPDGERPHIGRSARHASKVSTCPSISVLTAQKYKTTDRLCDAFYRLLQPKLQPGTSDNLQAQPCSLHFTSAVMTTLQLLLDIAALSIFVVVQHVE